MPKKIISLAILFVLLLMLGSCSPTSNRYSNSVAVYADDMDSLYLYTGNKSVLLTYELFKTDTSEDLPLYKISPEQYCFYSTDAERIFFPEKVYRQSGVTVINLCAKDIESSLDKKEIAQNVLTYVADSTGSLVAYQTTNKGFFATDVNTGESTLVTKATVSDYCISDVDTSLYYIYGGKLNMFADSKVTALFSGNATKIFCVRDGNVFFEAKVNNVPRLFVYNGKKCISLVDKPSVVNCDAENFCVLTTSGEIYQCKDKTEFSDLTLMYTGAVPGVLALESDGEICYVKRNADEKDKYNLFIGSEMIPENISYRSIKYIADHKSLFITGDTSVKTCKNNFITTVHEWPKEALAEDGFEGYANYYVTDDGTMYMEEELLDLYDGHYSTKYYVVKMGVKHKIKEIYGRFAYLALPVCDPSVTVPVK